MANFGKFSKSQLEYRLEALQTRLEGQPDSDEIRRLLLDLQVHRIELELQNRELREAQRELEQARDRYADLYDFAPVGYITLERTGKIVEINLTGATILGRERARIVGMPLSTFLPPVELPRLFEHLKSVFRESGKSTTQLRLQPREGDPLDVVLESIAVDSADGGGFCRTAIVDITKRKQAEDALRRAYDELEERVLARTAELAQTNTSLSVSEARLASAQAMAHLGSWEWNLETGEQVWSDEMFRIFGFEPQAFKPDYERFLKSIHPDDRAQVRERLQRALATGEMPEFEFRIMRPNQEQRVLRSRGEVIGSADGRALRAIGILQDITESERTAESLRQAAVVFDNTDQGIIVTDA
ncbi:MAG: PAS domain-containing protein, partial [Gammaproteobacteria bacterium]